MTEIVFPVSPSDGDTYTSGDRVFTYNAAKDRWSSKNFRAFESKIEQIRAALAAINVDISTATVQDLPTLIESARDLNALPVDNSVTADTYVRVADWLALPTVTASDEKVVGLFAVFEDPQKNWASIICRGAYTVDWGDGTVENFNDNTYATHQYQYADLNSNTLSTRGYRQAIITITPQAGASLTEVRVGQLQNFNTVQRYSSNNFLDLKISLPNCTFLQISRNDYRSAMLKSVEILSLNSTNISYMFEAAYNLQRVIFNNSALPTTCRYMFSSCFSLEKIHTFNVDMSSCTDFEGLFQNCYEILETPNMNTSAGIDFRSIFSNCQRLKRINSTYNFDNVVDAYGMFTNCYQLVEIPAIDLSNVVGGNLAALYQGCYNLVKVPDNIWPTGITSVNALFTSCNKISSVPVFDTSNVTDWRNFVSYCHNLKYFPAYDTSSGTNFDTMFLGCYNLNKIESLNTSNAVTMYYTFGVCSNLAEIPDINTSKVTNFYRTFSGCRSIRSVPAIDTSSGTNFRETFSGCTGLSSIPDLDCSKGTLFYGMFSACVSLKQCPTLNINPAVGKSSQAFYSMFSTCYNLQEYPNEDFSGGLDYTNMFYACYSLREITNIDLSTATNLYRTFYGCSNLEKISMVQPTGACSFRETFFGSGGLKSISNIDLANATQIGTSFYALYSITDLSGLTNIAKTIDLRFANMARQNIVDVFNNLSTVSGQTINVSGNPGSSSLTAEDIAIATNKGWTVTS